MGFESWIGIRYDGNKLAATLIRRGRASPWISRLSLTVRLLEHLPYYSLAPNDSSAGPQHRRLRGGSAIILVSMVSMHVAQEHGFRNLSSFASPFSAVVKVSPTSPGVLLISTSPIARHAGSFAGLATVPVMVHRPDGELPDLDFEFARLSLLVRGAPALRENPPVDQYLVELERLS
jgi:AraC-like DNA-binding protein